MITEETIKKAVKKVNQNRVKFHWKSFLIGMWVGIFMCLVIGLLILYI